MGLHLIEHARKRQIAKFVQVGTVCAYPRLAPVPFKEEDLWNGYPEETNAPYAIAKKSLFVMLDAYQQEYGLKSSVVVPVNLYGPGDNFDLQSSHVIPALIRKIEEAQKRGDDKIVCWGSGSASREFLFVDDAAAGIVQATLKIDSPEPINLGTGREIAIRDLVQLIAKICEFDGNIEWDATKPDGQPRRCLDITRAKERLHWQPEMQLEEGLRRTISWWRNQVSSGKFQESGV
jgi:GDP-L-fucose synthase